MMIPVQEAMRRLASAVPEREVPTVDGVALTGDRMEKRTNRLAREFDRPGLREGSFVTIALPNCVAFVEPALAALKLGATARRCCAAAASRASEA